MVLNKWSALIYPYTVNLLSLGLLGTSLPSYATEIHGYLRSGVGASRGGTDQVCFAAPSSSIGKARLGNECETYGELSVLQDMSAKEATAKFGLAMTLSLVSNGHADWESTSTSVTAETDEKKNTTYKTSTDFTLALRESYAYAQKIWGEKPKFWVGKRFYRRQDIHMFDFYYLNNSGPGLGIEDIPVGPSNLHVALTRNVPANDAGPVQTNVDVRLSDIGIATGTSLEAVIIAGLTGKRSANGVDKFEPQQGYQTSLILRHPVSSAENAVIVQYGLGLFGADDKSRDTLMGNFGNSGSASLLRSEDKQISARKKSSTWRVIDRLYGALTPNLSAEAVAFFQVSDFGGTKDDLDRATLDKSELTLGVRPVYAFSDVTSLAFEYAYTTIDNVSYNTNSKSYNDAKLHKVTIAPQLSPSLGYFTRPQLRLFATYAAWDNDSKGKVGGNVYASNKSGFSVGSQVEAWW